MSKKLNAGDNFKKLVNSALKNRGFHVITSPTVSVNLPDRESVSFDYLVPELNCVFKAFWQSESGSSDDKAHMWHRIAESGLDYTFIGVVCGPRTERISLALSQMVFPHRVMDMNEFTQWAACIETEEMMLFRT